MTASTRAAPASEAVSTPENSDDGMNEGENRGSMQGAKEAFCEIYIMDFFSTASSVSSLPFPRSFLVQMSWQLCSYLSPRARDELLLAAGKGAEPRENEDTAKKGRMQSQPPRRV